MSTLKPLQLIGSPSPAPNPWKVALILEELNLPYTLIHAGGFPDLKAEPFLSFNPNGRIPALVDPNRGNISIWESGAILEYLMDNYDPEHRLHSADFATSYAEKSLLHFQMSGQGPYFGQAIWFSFFHSEKIQSAVDRYLDEAERVTGVLDKILREKGDEWLTGEKLSYVDLAFVPWLISVERVFSRGRGDQPGPRPGMQQDLEKKCPAWAGWWKRITARPVVERLVKAMLADDYSAWDYSKTTADLAKEVGI